MAEEKSNGEKAREIVSLLPKENCGKCGFANCGEFALAVAEGKASPCGCHKDPAAGYEISKLLGIEVPQGVELASLGRRMRRHLHHHYANPHGHHGRGCGHGRDRHRHPGSHFARWLGR